VLLNDNDCPSLQVGGVDDHVHLLFGLSRTLAIAEIVETLKVASSKWIKTKSGQLAEFHWQHGYGAFSIGQSQATRVYATSKISANIIGGFRFRTSFAVCCSGIRLRSANGTSGIETRPFRPP